MFNKKQGSENISQEKFNTIIGKNTSFEGQLKGDGTIRIDGEVRGEVSIKGDVYLGETAVIAGNIYAVNIIAAGKVDGNITASEQLRITSTGRILGDVKAKTFIVDEDAFFEGKCTMTQQSAVDNRKELENNKLNVVKG
ncbi:protein CcmA, bactofilin family [Natronincola peptidivorans]|uniref:Protein CcmA, bactofilin family n=1 Tax=Natronincola peptidivorans TaxID=426128 RepID=A0A1I0GEG1_9FIRM|nr:polymer-forming cytoskeletal protein [Natronincola peptidivorans]SET69443.1 protein CcmA, bactofilin family [Natronincola peptidivorans]